VDSFRRPVFQRFISWIRFVRSKIPNYTIRFVLEGFVYESRILIKNLNYISTDQSELNEIKNVASDHLGFVLANLMVSKGEKVGACPFPESESPSQIIPTIDKMSNIKGKLNRKFPIREGMWVFKGPPPPPH
jgi:hypothetical protein